MDKVLTLKGRREGVIFCAKRPCSFELFFEEFKKLIKAEISFLKGGKILGLEGIELSDEEKKIFLDYVNQIEEIDFLSFEYRAKINDTERLEISSKKEAERGIEESKKGVLKNLLEEEDFMADSLFHVGTVRSGIRLESDKNIVVVGDVNPGAELIAKSNIVVLGKLKGFAHAGADGSEDKIIAAWKLQPTQIRIADYITMPPEGELEDIDYPEMAMIEGDRVIIKAYQ